MVGRPAIREGRAGGRPLIPAAGSCPGFRKPVLRLTLGFSGLKFSLTRALDGLSRWPASLSCSADEPMPVGTLTA
jgi:hypothetical protein